MARLLMKANMRHILQHVAFRKVMIRSTSDFRLGCSGMVPNPRIPHPMLSHTYLIQRLPSLCLKVHIHSTFIYCLDVLWGQPIKLIQVASTSELLEHQWISLFSSKSFPLISAGPRKPQNLTVLKIKYEKFRPNVLIPC